LRMKGWFARVAPMRVLLSDMRFDFDLIWFIYLRFNIHISDLNHWFLKCKRLQAGWKELV
jgi:hypothetical protein